MTLNSMLSTLCQHEWIGNILLLYTYQLPGTRKFLGAVCVFLLTSHSSLPTSKPDRDAIVEWREKIRELRYLANFTVSDFCEVMAPPDDLKYDIADFIVGNLKPWEGLKNCSGEVLDEVLRCLSVLVNLWVLVRYLFLERSFHNFIQKTLYK